MSTTAMPVRKLASLVGLYEQAADLRGEVADLESQLKPKKEELKEVEARILASLINSGTEAARTDLGTYTVRRSTVPQVVDWKLLDKFILKTKSLDLLHRRLTATAWSERTEAGIIVPGVESAVITTIAWRGAKA